jgi:hypothetical protein
MEDCGLPCSRHGREDRQRRRRQGGARVPIYAVASAHTEGGRRSETGCHCDTIVRLAKANALYLGGDVFAKIFDEDKLQQGAAPAGPKRIIEGSVKAAFMADSDNSAVLLSDISNAYNERAKAKMLSTLYARPELKHFGGVPI